ncbi:MAG: hypothetical protein LBB23_02520 [Rickettsiales bacterium]|nr:hypothetical protein [Rickettsiales bacterium]
MGNYKGKISACKVKLIKCSGWGQETPPRYLRETPPRLGGIFVHYPAATRHPFASEGDFCATTLSKGNYNNSDINVIRGNA